MSHYEKVSKLPGGRCHPEVICPKPCVKAWNEHCVTHCGDSCAVVCPPPVVVHFPGPILSTCPQESYVGTSAPLNGCRKYTPWKPIKVDQTQQEQTQFQKL